MSDNLGGRTPQREESFAKPESASLRDLILFFLKLGVTAFGGPAAHIAMMEEELVRRRRWLTHQQFLDLLGAANLIPGPSSTELAIYIGYRQAGIPGLIAAGACFILPASLIVLAIAWAYVRYGHLPQVSDILYGVEPVIMAVIVQAVWNLGRAAVKTRWLAALLVVCVSLGIGGAPPVLILFGAGIATGASGWAAHDRKQSAKPLLALAAAAAILFLAPWALTLIPTGRLTPGLAPLFLFFLKVGSVVYGSGYVLLAFLRDDLVTRTHWLTSARLLDAIAVGQVTPGPVFTTATFIGYLLRGLPGAAVGTIGIFLPGFILVAVTAPYIPRLRASATASSFLDGVNIASLALMAVVSWELGRAALVDPLTVVLALVSAALLLRFRLNSAWIVLGGAVFGLIARALHTIH